MTAMNQDVTMMTGDDIDIVVTIVDTAGAVVDITGATAAYTASLDTPFSKSVGAGISLSDPTNGEMTISIVPADVPDNSGGTMGTALAYAHDARITLGGKTYTVFAGNLNLIKSQA